MLEGGASAEPSKEEAAAAEAKRQSEEAWTTYVEGIHEVGDKAATAENTFRTVLLGRGASAAYIIENGGVPTDTTTLVIGQAQPWREERGRQGVINHPHNMIDPQHKGGPIDMDDDGLAERGELSNRVDEVIERLPNLLDAQVTSVQKCGEGANAHYRIETSEGPRFAQRVIAAMGIGNHKKPGGVSEQSYAQRVDIPEQDQGEEPTSVPRIMDMDELQRHVASGKFKPEHAPKGLAVVGPNAAIDVMSTGLRNDFKLFWVTGRGRPAFLKGTDNEFVEQEFNKAKQPQGGGAFDVIPWDYLRATASPEGVKVEYGVRADNRGGLKVPEKVEGGQDASFMVYGVGPDVEAMMEKFPDVKSGKQKLEPIYDLGLHFNADPTDIDAVHQSIGDEEKRRQVIAIIGNLTPIERKPDKDAMKDERLTSKLPTVVGVKATKDPQHQDDPTSLELTSGMAFRFATQQKMTYRYVSMRMTELQTEAMAGFPLEQVTLSQNPAYKDLLACAQRVRDSITTLMEDMLPLVVSIEDNKPSKEAEEAILTFLRGRYEIQLQVTHMYAVLSGALEQEATLHDEANQLARHVNGLNDRLPQLADQLEELTSRGVSGSDQVSNQMNLTAKTLPANVLLSDQLTTSRASIEARQESMPATVAKAVDFITNDQTVIAAHIASTYATIPPVLANYVTAKIIDDRRHLPLEEAPLPRPQGEVGKNTKFTLEQQQKFQGGWSVKLTKLANLF